MEKTGKNKKKQVKIRKNKNFSESITNEINQWLVSLEINSQCNISFEEIQPSNNLLISKSNTDNINIYISTSKNNKLNNIGIDIENIHRQISPKLFNRITSQTEREIFTENNTLKIWTIKEALFKAKTNNKNTVISDYIILGNNTACYKSIDKKVKYFHKSITVEEYIITIAVECNIC